MYLTPNGRVILEDDERETIRNWEKEMEVLLDEIREEKTPDVASSGA